jgi:hypothetical protein
MRIKIAFDQDGDRGDWPEMDQSVGIVDASWD